MFIHFFLQHTIKWLFIEIHLLTACWYAKLCAENMSSGSTCSTQATYAIGGKSSNCLNTLWLMTRASYWADMFVSRKSFVCIQPYWRLMILHDVIVSIELSSMPIKYSDAINNFHLSTFDVSIRHAEIAVPRGFPGTSNATDWSEQCFLVMLSWTVKAPCLTFSMDMFLSWCNGTGEWFFCLISWKLCAFS